MCYIVDVNNLQKEIYQTKKLYRDVFNKVKEALDSQIASLKSSSLCNHCKQDCDIDFNKIDIFQEFPKGCRYRFWQESVLDLLENRISKDILEYGHQHQYYYSDIFYQFCYYDHYLQICLCQ